MRTNLEFKRKRKHFIIYYFYEIPIVRVESPLLAKIFKKKTCTSDIDYHHTMLYLKYL